MKAREVVAGAILVSGAIALACACAFANGLLAFALVGVAGLVPIAWAIREPAGAVRPKLASASRPSPRLGTIDDGPRPLAYPSLVLLPRRVAPWIDQAPPPAPFEGRTAQVGLD